jgi:hypothetical protein
MFMKKTFLLLLTVMLAFSMTLVSCGGDDEGPSVNKLPTGTDAVIKLATEYIGDISGVIEPENAGEGWCFEKIFTISDETFALGDQFKVTLTLGTGANKFNQVFISSSVDAFNYKGSRDGNWQSTGEGINRTVLVKTVQLYNDVDEKDETAEPKLSTAAKDDDGNDNTAIDPPYEAKLRIRFKTGGGSNATGFEEGEAVTVKIKSLKAEKLAPASTYTVTFKTNGGTPTEDVFVSVDAIAPDYDGTKDVHNYDVIPAASIPTLTPPEGKSSGGWSTTKDDINTLFVTTTPITADTVLYALWVEPTITDLGLNIIAGSGSQQFKIPLENILATADSSDVVLTLGNNVVWSYTGGAGQAVFEPGWVASDITLPDVSGGDNTLTLKAGVIKRAATGKAEITHLLLNLWNFADGPKNSTSPEIDFAGSKAELFEYE